MPNRHQPLTAHPVRLLAVVAAALALNFGAAATPAAADFGPARTDIGSAGTLTPQTPIPQHLPDLVVSTTGHVTYPARLCLFGECVASTLFRLSDLRISVQNRGTGPSPATEVLVQSPGSFSGTDFVRVAVPAIPANTILRLDGPQVDCTGGPTHLSVDQGNLIRESNETNNTFEYTC